MIDIIPLPLQKHSYGFLPHNAHQCVHTRRLYFWTHFGLPYTRKEDLWQHMCVFSPLPKVILASDHFSSGGA